MSETLQVPDGASYRAHAAAEAEAGFQKDEAAYAEQGVNRALARIRRRDAISASAEPGNTMVDAVKAKLRGEAEDAALNAGNKAVEASDARALADDVLAKGTEFYDANREAVQAEAYELSKQPPKYDAEGRNTGGSPNAVIRDTEVK